MSLEDILVEGKEMSLFYDMCQEVVDSECQIGKMSCNYNISLTIYLERNAVKTNIQKLYSY